MVVAASAMKMPLAMPTISPGAPAPSDMPNSQDPKPPFIVTHLRSASLPLGFGQGASRTGSDHHNDSVRRRGWHPCDHMGNPNVPFTRSVSGGGARAG